MRDIILFLFQALNLFRLLIFSIAGLIFFFNSDQIRSITNIDAVNNHSIQFMFSSLALVFFVIVINWSVEHLLAKNEATGTYPLLCNISKRYVRLFLHTFTLSGIFYHATMWSTKDYINVFNLTVVVISCLAAIIALCWTIYLTSERTGNQYNVSIFSTFIFVVLALAIPFIPTYVLGLYGAQAILFTFFGIMLLITSPLQIYLDYRNIPLFISVVIFTSAISFFFYDRNHEIRRSLSNIRQESLFTAKNAFTQWLLCRPNLNKYTKVKPFPVILISAEGGGSFASYQTALVLSRIEGQNPQFHQHIFAMSGVSGGTWGLTSFAAALNDRLPQSAEDTHAPCPRTDVQPLNSAETIEKQLDQFYSNDFLSPLVGGLLFSDFLQKWIPFDSAMLDRARFFELTLESEWRRVANERSPNNAPTFFSKDFYDLWHPNRDLPAIIANTVSADTGMSVQISQFTDFTPSISAAYRTGIGQVQVTPFSDLLGDGDANAKSINVSTAVGLSARFPYLFPSGVVFLDPEKQLPFRMVDGGYYDNTGANVSALLYDALISYKKDILDSIKLKTNFDIEYNIILINIGSFSLNPRINYGGFNELLGPIRAISNTREFRTYNTRAAIRHRGIPHINFVLDSDRFSFPLALHLSRSVATEIGNRIGSPSDCQRAAQDIANALRTYPITYPEVRDELIQHNACMQKAVGIFLAGAIF